MQKKTAACAAVFLWLVNDKFSDKTPDRGELWLSAKAEGGSAQYVKPDRFMRLRVNAD